MTPSELQASVNKFLRQGGLITKLDYAGNVTGLYSASVPREPVAPVRVPEPVQVDVIGELRRIRVAAREALARLNAVCPLDEAA